MTHCIYQYFISDYSIFLILDSNVLHDQQTVSLNNDSKYYLISATHELLKENTQWQHNLQQEKQKIRDTIMNGSDMDEFNERSISNIPNVTVARSDSLMDISGYDSENQRVDIQSVIKTAAPIISRQKVMDEFTLNEDQCRAFLIITSHLDGDSFLKQGKNKLILL